VCCSRIELSLSSCIELTVNVVVRRYRRSVWACQDVATLRPVSLRQTPGRWGPCRDPWGLCLFKEGGFLLGVAFLIGTLPQPTTHSFMFYVHVLRFTGRHFFFTWVHPFHTALLFIYTYINIHFILFACALLHLLESCSYISIYIYIYLDIYLHYIYIYRERERYTYTYTDI